MWGARGGGGGGGGGGCCYAQRCNVNGVNRTDVSVINCGGKVTRKCP